MLTVRRLVELALGKDEARHVDGAIPQHVFTLLTPRERENNAGWYYPVVGVDINGHKTRSLMGEWLTQSKCWEIIIQKLTTGQLGAYIGSEGYNIGYIAANWKCLRGHCERGEITLSEDVEP